MYRNRKFGQRLGLGASRGAQQQVQPGEGTDNMNGLRTVNRDARATIYRASVNLRGPVDAAHAKRPHVADPSFALI